MTNILVDIYASHHVLHDILRRLNPIYLTLKIIFIEYVVQEYLYYNLT